MAEPKLCYAVITRVPIMPNEGDGNLADDMVMTLRDGTMIVCPSNDVITDKFWDPKLSPSIFVKNTVFMLGEIVILDAPDGREIVPQMRKPNKWSVDYEVFETIEGAIHRSEEALKEQFIIKTPLGTKEEPVFVYNSLSHRLNEVKTREEAREFLRRYPGEIWWENPKTADRNPHITIKLVDEENDEIQDL